MYEQLYSMYLYAVSFLDQFTQNSVHRNSIIYDTIQQMEAKTQNATKKGKLNWERFLVKLLTNERIWSKHALAILAAVDKQYGSRTQG